MTALAVSPADQETLLLGALIGLVILRRAFAQYRGTPVSAARLLGFTLIYPLLFALVAGVESLPVLPLWSLAVDVAAAVAGTFAALRYVESRVTVYQEGGAWMYRLGPVVPIVYVVLFLARLGLELGIGIDPFAPSTAAISTGAATVLEVVDVLFGFSTGLAMGRNLGVYEVWRRRSASPAPAPLRSEPS
jgi:hypothetical protein